MWSYENHASFVFLIACIESAVERSRARESKANGAYQARKANEIAESSAESKS
ncbi:hypothetical protein BIFPSEUDO_04253 [Bifidobacterium pseudocatenulatum DSM 20438 = JCM 1200 = LMG 10505]|uniref:Uncharacterized protein n=1 Tax=Bifidobacterium pseudocatenulatum DSM 20438 = JCM 1200 = LMG 10505 TaxID=547043 RepID=C0BV12_BIFPS|nr:hypothetical protein BIFPSEUDO_04253 [Bifidobacterium pseudocatenulatum DSM 20438 = JCM 1200 = LMG 10505]BAR04236.1 hypothetical protein BBPC_1558 [Bifidobacterium pseudocatenulatum DSM 20438 = JCM 1200 = LMG 10505]